MARNVYVILEFANENVLDGEDKTIPVQVGFSEWLIFDDKCPKISIEDLIYSERLVRSKWPSNYDVQPRKTMSKMKEVMWKEVVAYVRGHANKWEDAIQGSKNFIDTGVCFPTRKERKEFAKLKKEEADDQYLFSTHQSTKFQPQAKKKGTQKSAMTGSTQISSILTKMKQQNVNVNDDSTSTDSRNSSSFTSKESQKSERIQTSLTKTSKKRPFSTFKDTSESEENEKEKLKIRTKNKKRKSKFSKKRHMKYSLSSELNSNESKESISSRSEDVYSQNKRLKKEIKSLKIELGAYKAMKVMVEEFTHLPHQVKNICEKLQKHLEDNPGSSSKEVTVSVPISESKKPTFNLDNSHLMDISKRSKPLLISSVKTDINISSIPEENTEQLKDPLDILPINNCNAALSTTITISDTDNTSISEDQGVRFGSRIVSNSIINKVRHGKIGLLANGLAEAVFTPEEMALGTIKGGKTNAHKGVFQKKCLDQSLVQAIIEYCAKHFNKQISEVSSEVIKSIGFKLNNFTKTEEGKKIINKHKLISLGLSIDLPSQSTSN
ncbi:uncharacterized protein [Temnothorax nylanderi]|uniref:uncharacterized protein n=1 Tax=Temnothorax nylanderi TaxID=102681 RepID=UPI003A83645A